MHETDHKWNTAECKGREEGGVGLEQSMEDK